MITKKDFIEYINHLPDDTKFYVIGNDFGEITEVPMELPDPKNKKKLYNVSFNPNGNALTLGEI